MRDRTKIAIGLGVVAGIGTAIYFATRAEAAGEIPLSAGWNEVTYTGPAQTAGEAFASIEPYLIIVTIYEEEFDQWFALSAADYIWSGMVLSIKVSEDCIWTF